MMKFLMKILKLKSHALDFIDSEKHFRYLKRFLVMNQLKIFKVDEKRRTTFF